MKRGKLDGALRFEPAAGGRDSLQVDEDRARAVGNALSQVAGLVGASAPVNPAEVLRWPGVVQEPPLDVAAVGQTALKLLEQTLGDLAAARGREGERTAAVLNDRAKLITAIVGELRKREGAMIAALRDKLRARVEELRASQELVRLEQAEDFPCLSAEIEREFNWLSTGRPAGFGWMAQDLSASGAIGNAARATARKGEACADYGATAFIELLQDIDGFELTRLKEGPLP